MKTTQQIAIESYEELDRLHSRIGMALDKMEILAKTSPAATGKPMQEADIDQIVISILTESTDLFKLGVTLVRNMTVVKNLIPDHTQPHTTNGNPQTHSDTSQNTNNKTCNASKKVTRSRPYSQ
jgi:hypothetical protein